MGGDSIAAYLSQIMAGIQRKWHIEGKHLLSE